MKRKYNQFHYLKNGARGFWEPFNILNQTGKTTKYPNKTDKIMCPYCIVRHTDAELQELVMSLSNRDFENDNLIFLKIMTYVGDKHLQLRIGMEKYDNSEIDIIWYPYPFAFIKDYVEGKFKFLPIRLHQFRDIWKGYDRYNLKGEDYTITKPWEMEINLNITGPCWQKENVQTFEYDGVEMIEGISEWAKDAIMSHLIKYLEEFTKACKADYGGMWKTDPYRSVCYVRNAEDHRYSVPFVLVECCRKTYNKAGEGDLPPPLECEHVEELVRTIQLGIYICVVIIFLFLPLLVNYVPSKPEPYKRIVKNNEPQQLGDHEECPTGSGNVQSSGKAQPSEQTTFLLW